MDKPFKKRENHIDFIEQKQLCITHVAALAQLHFIDCGILFLAQQDRGKWKKIKNKKSQCKD